MQTIKNLFLKKRTWGIILLLFLTCLGSAGIYFYQLPKNKVLRSLSKTFWSDHAPLSLKQPAEYLENGEFTMDLSLVLEQLDIPSLHSSAADILSLIEGLTLDSQLHYSILDEKMDGALSFSYLYKPYLEAATYAQNDNLYLKAPDLLDNYFKIDTFGIPIFPEGLQQIRSCFSSSAQNTTDEENSLLNSMEVLQLDASNYQLQFSSGEIVSLEIGEDGLVHSLSHHAQDYQLDFKDTQLTLKTAFLNPVDSSRYETIIKGTYLPTDTENNPALHFDSIEVTDAASGLSLHLSGDLSLREFQEIGPAPDGKIYDLFHLTAKEYTLLSAKILKNLLTSELAPFLPYF